MTEVSFTPVIVYAHASSSYPWQVALQRCPPSFHLMREDGHQPTMRSVLCHFGLPQLVGCAALDHGANALDHLVAYGVQHAHGVLSFGHFAFVIVAQFASAASHAKHSHVQQ